METQRCLYDILGVEATASNEEIRSAYRKLAMKWHPDKIQQSGASAEECHEATIHFQEIGRAYEVLADPSERSWYDTHRSQILSSSSSSPSDFDFNPWPFFSPSVFAGYGDTGKGFYAVYGELFKTLHHQEVSFANARGLRTPLYPPDMGNLTTLYSQVQKFYNYWLGFSTLKDFAWCDEYKASAGPNRKVRRLMEEENKKIRSKARKEFNEAIRHLAAFVRKRDKRVLERKIEVQRLEKEKEEMRNARRRKEEEEKRMKARLFEEAEWTKVESEQDVDDGSDFDESVGSYAWRQVHLKDNGAKKERQDEFYCIVCNKKFKSDEQWRNHERSKKHLEKVAMLRDSFEEDDKEFEAISHGAMQDNVSLEIKTSAGIISKSEESSSSSGIKLLNADLLGKGNATTSTDNSAVDYKAERALAGSLKNNRGQGSALSTESESDDVGSEDGDGNDDEFDSLLTMVNSYASRHRQSASEGNDDTAEHSASGQGPSEEEGEVLESGEEFLATRLNSGQIQEAYESNEDFENSSNSGKTFTIEEQANGESDGEIVGPSKKKKSRGRLCNKKQQAAHLSRHSKIAEELLHEKQLDVMMQKLEALNSDEREPCSLLQASQDIGMSGKNVSNVNKGQKFEKRYSQENSSSKGKNLNVHLMMDSEQPRRPARGKKSKVLL
ncbi:hypothetical protein L7F22_023944 [Adiantum nelumboides]|nr:hypothetical protein [Adiantum nelumboides]